MTRVVLASASPGRRMVLRQAGIDPIVVVSGVDEDALIAAQERAAPGDVANALAAAKAEYVVTDLDPALAADCVVIGCDSMLFIDGALRGKPGSVAEARQQWDTMCGRSGVLYTGHCAIRLRDGAETHRSVEFGATTVRFAHPTEAELTAYLASGESLRVAGAFTIDGLGGWFVDGIDGDPSNVVGLSLPTMRGLFARAGLSIAELWSDNPL
jgi:septum formation protein